MKLGDKIIITEVLSVIKPESLYIGKIGVIIHMDSRAGDRFPYRVKIGTDGGIWCNGIAWTPLIEELV